MGLLERIPGLGLFLGGGKDGDSKDMVPATAGAGLSGELTAGVGRTRIVKDPERDIMLEIAEISASNQLGMRVAASATKELSGNLFESVSVALQGIHFSGQAAASVGTPTPAKKK